MCDAPSRADPLRSVLRMRVRCPEGPRFGLVLSMNSRNFRWFASLYTLAGTPIMQSLGIVDCCCILSPFRARADLPPGQLYFLDTTGAGEVPRGYGCWRERWIMRYRMAADVSVATLPRVV